MAKESGGHRIRFGLLDMLEMKQAFRCTHCDCWVEPAPKWRRARKILNIASIVGVIVAAFQPLEGTWQAFVRMVLAILLILALFLTLTYLILTRAPLVLARASVNPEIQELRRQQEEDTRGLSDADYDEDAKTLPVGRVGEKAFRTGEEEEAISHKQYEQAEAEALEIQNRVKRDAETVRKKLGSGKSGG